MFEKIAVSLPQHGEPRRPPSVSSPSIAPEKTEWITTQVHLFFGSFRKADADNAEVFSAGCVRLFGDYPPDVVAWVVDPLTGLPGKSEWLPSLRAVKQALDERHDDVTRIERFKEAQQQQLADRKAAEAARAHRPTYDELKARHGPGWGLATVAERDDELRQRALALVAEANNRLLQRVGVAHEAAPGIPVSTALERILGGTAC
jgi:hypothetical protein